MKPSDYIKIDVPGDGSCLFHSIAWILELNEDARYSKTYYTIRHLVVLKY